jgi:WD40 repeat protein
MRRHESLISSLLLVVIAVGFGACAESAATPVAEPRISSPVVVSVPGATSTPTIHLTPTTLPTAQVEIPITVQNASALGSEETINQAGAYDFKWCEDGGSLCLMFPDKIEVYDMEKDAVSQRMSVNSPKLLAVSSDGETLAWVEGEGEIRIWNPYQGYDNLVDTGAESIIDLIFDPTGASVVATTGDYQMLTWKVNGVESVYPVSYPGWLVGLDFSPDGWQLAGVSQEEFAVPIFDVKTGLEQRRLEWTEHASPVLYGAYFSPNWQTLAWVARGTIQLMDVADARLGSALNHEDFIVATSWSPNSALIASAAAGMKDGNYTPLVFLWDVATGQSVATLVHDAPILQIAFSPDGSQLATLDSDGIIRLFAIVKV